MFKKLLSSCLIIISNVNLISSQGQGTGTGTAPAPPAPPAPAGKQPHWCPPNHPYKGGPVTGPFGQDCTPDQGDCPGACPVTNGVYSILEATNGKLECGVNFDCCTCKLMLCEKCVELSCNGDSGCYGAKNIQIQGTDVGGGAVINCNGDLSCKETVIEGFNIASILCSGDQSCQFAKMTLVCDATEGCTLLCVGDNSCSSDYALGLYATFLITNANGISCSAAACQYGYFRLDKNKGGYISCSAYDSCKGSTIIADQNILSMSCAGLDACRDSQIYLTNPDPGFSLFCGAANSCNGMTIYITITDPTIETLDGIQCNGPSACEGARVIIQTAGRYPRGQELTVSGLTCGAPRACANMFISKGVNIKFASCMCGTASLASDRPCEGLTGLPQCHQPPPTPQPTAAAV